MPSKYHALADPTRRRILALLRERRRTAGELATEFALAKPTLSRHFAVLREAGLIEGEKRGTTITYRLNVSVLEDALFQLMDTFEIGEKEMRQWRKKQQTSGVIAVSALGVFVLMVAMSVWGWFAIPSGTAVPIHWNASGQVDSTGAKWFALLFIPLLMHPLLAGPFLLAAYVESLSSPSHARDRFVRGGWYGAIAVMLLSHSCVILAGAGVDINVAWVILVTFGVLFILGGNAMGKLRPDRDIMGAPSPDALEDPEVWDKLNRRAGRVTVAGGVLIVATATHWPGFAWYVFFAYLVCWIPWCLYQGRRIRRSQRKEEAQEVVDLRHDTVLRVFPAAPWDTTIWVMTGFCWLLMGGLTVLYAVIFPWLVLAILPIAVLVLGVCAIWAPKSFAVAERSLRIQCYFTQIILPRDQVQSVRPTTRDDMRWTLRTFGVGGLYGNYGHFTNRTFGAFVAYMTRAAPGVLVRLANGKKYIITPADADGFIEALGAPIEVVAESVAREKRPGLVESFLRDITRR